MARHPLLERHAKKCVEHAGLTGTQLKKLWIMFQRLEARSHEHGVHSGANLAESLGQDKAAADAAMRISLKALYNYINEPLTDFSLRIFALLDKEHCEELDWGDFVELVVTLSMMSRDDMRKFAFYAMDRGGVGGLQLEEFRSLCEELHGGRLNSEDDSAVLTAPVDESGALIRYPQFLYMDETYPHLLAPCFRLQRQFQEATLGEKRWRKQREKVQDMRLREKSQPGRMCEKEMKKNARMTKKHMGELKGCCWMSGYNCCGCILICCPCFRAPIPPEQRIKVFAGDGPDDQHVYPQMQASVADLEPARIGRFCQVNERTLAIIIQPKGIKGKKEAKNPEATEGAVDSADGSTPKGEEEEEGSAPAEEGGGKHRKKERRKSVLELVEDRIETADEQQVKTDSRRRRTEMRKNRRAGEKVADGKQSEGGDAEGKTKRRHHKSKDKDGKIVPS